MTKLKERKKSSRLKTADETPVETILVVDELPPHVEGPVPPRVEEPVPPSAESVTPSAQLPPGDQVATPNPEPVSGQFLNSGLAGLVGFSLGFALNRAYEYLPFDVPPVVRLVLLVTMPILTAAMAIALAAKAARAKVPLEIQQMRSEVDRHKVPFCLLLVLLCVPKTMLVFVPAVLLWSACQWVYRRLPLNTRLRIKRSIPETVAQSALATELLDGVAQVRPFILFALYIFCAPIAVMWMFVHWVQTMLGWRQKTTPATPRLEPDTLSFTQNRQTAEEESESNFFHSPAFFLTALVLFGCGLPALFTFYLYQHLGIDAMFGFPSTDPHFKKTFLIIDLYIASIGCCICVFFLRNWFTFPLHYFGEETSIEIDERKVHKRVLGWFTQVITWNAPWAGPDTLRWDEIKCVRVGQHARRLHPLPTTVMPADSITYKLLNSLALLIDSISHRSNFEEFLYFRTEEYGGNEIRLRLAELNGDERARLFYALRKWAPAEALGESVQEKLIGSKVLAAPRYTQMWFELLTDKMQRKRAGTLSAGDTLGDGKFTVDNRLASGGQANVYLAHSADGSEVVLKEFILSTSDAVGSLIESGAEFETESTLLSQLAHPRIVRMLDFFAEDRRLYLVLEKVQGQSLRQRIKQNQPLTEQETVKIAVQLCEVLEYLHGQQPAIVHRDIAPDNIMIADNGEIKLIDFSLAAAKKSKRTTSTMGKHCYAPPEQFREQPCPQSDIYALGATMYFLLTGEDPKPITPSDLLSKKPDSTARLAQIIERATAFDLNDRYSDVSWLKLELQDLAN